MITENGVTTEFMTFNGLVLSGYNKDGEQTEHYYYGGSLLSAEYVSEETGLYYYLKNSHGDVIGLTDSNGALTETYRYDAFGTLTSIQSINENGVLAETDTALSRFIYAGEQLDNITGLYYLRARQYDTVIGRFTQKDTYLGDGRNLYVYVSNNPLKYTDPSGHDKDLGYAGSMLIPADLAEFMKWQEESEENVWLNAINAGFTTPDSYSGYLGQQWGNYIAPTVQNDPSGSAYAFKEGFLDAVIPLRSSDDYYHTDLYMTGQLFGMIFTGGVSEAISGMNAISNIRFPMGGMQPEYAIAGAGSYSMILDGIIDGAVVAEGFAGAYFGWSAGSTIGSAVQNAGTVIESGSSSSKPNQVHHYATDKSKTYTPQLEEIANNYGFDLDDAWNKDLLPHQGRHPNAYHEYILDSMKQFDEIAQGDKDIFLELFDNLKNNVKSNPDMLYKDYWK